MAQPSGRKECPRESGRGVKRGPIDHDAIGVDENGKTGGNQESSDMMNIDSALWEMGERFQINIVKCGESCYTVKCASKECPWQMNAARLLGNRFFKFKNVQSEHKCGLTAHDQASGLFGEYSSLLPQYCNLVRETNPGSLASVSVNNPMDVCSLRLFISYQASIYGFLNACRPVIWLDRTVLRYKYLLINLLVATSIDGDGAIFPLAFGVVGQENDANWMWFLSELQNLLVTRAEYIPILTILSNRHHSIVAAVRTNFPAAYHRYSMLHVSKCFQKLFHNSILVNHLWKAANALEPLEFNLEVMNIEKISLDAARWVRTIPPHLWTNSHYKGRCFIHPTVSFVESLNAWIHEARGLPIVQTMECIHHKLMYLFNERREASMKWTSVLVPSAERQVAQAVKRARSYEVSRRNEDEYVVITQECQEVVDFREGCCSCGRWQRYGIPCSHAAATLLCRQQNIYRFAWKKFTAETYCKTYSQRIHPIFLDNVVSSKGARAAEEKEHSK